MLDRSAFISLALLSASVACTPKAPEPAAEKRDPVTASDPPAPSDGDRVPAFAEPVRTRLLLERHESTQPTATYALVNLDPPLLALGSSAGRPALPMPNWPDHWSTVVAHGGGETMAAAEATAGKHRVRIGKIEPGDDDLRVELEAAPAALHLVEDLLFVGIGNTVGYVDLAASAPKFEAIHTRPDMQFKAYDLFAREGDWLIAVDDQVVPMYGDAFRIVPGAPPVHEDGWAMPGIINGTYEMGLLRSTGRKQGALYLVASYGIMDGHGHDLVKLSLKDGKLAVGSEVTINSGRTADPPVLEEHVSRATGKPEKLAAGEQFTAWTGLAGLPGPRADLFVAAGTRGLLLIPEQFGPDTKARAIDVGGPCTDVLIEANRVFALVGGEAPAIVELDVALAERGRAPLPEPFDQFVD